MRVYNAVPIIIEHHQATSGEINQLDLLSQSFMSVARGRGLSIPTDFCELALKAMAVLKESGMSNVLYRLARALATPCTDGTGSLFPTDRMPMGLLEYMAGFFDSNTYPQV